MTLQIKAENLEQEKARHPPERAKMGARLEGLEERYCGGLSRESNREVVPESVDAAGWWRDN